MDNTMSVAPLQHSERALFAEALAAEGLVVDDLDEAGRRFFTFRDDRDTIIGFGGYEECGDSVLMRSMVILSDHRGRGFGRRMVEMVCRETAKTGHETIWLLTETAAPFFEKCGFSAVPRETAPAEIRQSRQYSGLCPASATLMVRSG